MFYNYSKWSEDYQNTKYVMLVVPLTSDLTSISSPARVTLTLLAAGGVNLTGPPIDIDSFMEMVNVQLCHS